MKNLITLIGACAGICTTFSFLPQVIKTWREHATKNISLAMYIVFCTGTLLWLIYGFMLHSYPLIVSNTITLILAVIILFMKLFWK